MEFLWGGALFSARNHQHCHEFFANDFYDCLRILNPARVHVFHKIAACPHKRVREDVLSHFLARDCKMPKRKEAAGAKPRGSCTVCHKGFGNATDEQFRQRLTYHLMFSERHKKYSALQRGQQS
jgi:hypothetical protein